MIKFSNTDKARITAAIQAAEKNTSGEFVAVVARISDHYVFLPLLWAAVAALILPGILYLVSAPLAWVNIYQIQLLLFIVLALVFLFVPEFHMHLVPRHVKHSRARRLAHAQFYEQGVHMTREHSGVLFFVSLAEHYVEIVADKGIHEKLGEAHWQGIIQAFVSDVKAGRVVDGFVAAIGACGKAMAEHYPPEPGNPEELSDGLIEI
ncbi:MAG: TPM domain-containing protein [Gammaproteobacteria bacterium]|nr:TPM domain-containing protein [Gammaproteobacteria bacterium]